MRHQFGWDYPPGVTGNEPQIVGYPPCVECGHEHEEHEEVQNDENRQVEVCHGLPNNGCFCAGYEQYAEEETK